MARLRGPALLLVAMGALSLALPGTAQPDTVSEAHRPVVVQEATADVTFEPDLGLLDTSGRGNCVDGESIVVNIAGGFFTFEEDQFQTRCAEAQLRLTVPDGVSVLGINFTADRRVTAAQDTLAEQGFTTAFTPLLLQYYELTTPDDPTFNRRSDYYTAGSNSSEARDFADIYLLPAGLATLNMTWHFEDPGQDQPVTNPFTQQPIQLTTGNAFGAMVSNLNFTWQDLPLALDAVEAAEERLEDEVLGVVDYRLRAQVPDPLAVAPEAFDPAVALDDTTLVAAVVSVAPGVTFLGVAGPQGDLGIGDYIVTETGDRLTVQLPERTLDAQGPGTYELRYQSIRLVPPPPPAEDPTRIYPFFFILAFLPMVAAALALHQTTVYVRQAEGPYRRTAWPITAAVGLVVLYYLILLVYSLFGIGPRAMSTLPLVREAVLVFIQFVLLLIMLSAAALAVSRTLMTSMRRDIEERERKEDQLRRSNEELERFAYVASHDLQEPLRKVAGFTALLQKKYAGRLDRDADEIIGYAVDGATRMQMLIKDILAYSRVGSRELQRVQVDAGAVMELVTADLGEPIKETKARVRWQELPTVRADASQLRQVLQNLVENAIKYHKPGRRPVVEVSGRGEGDHWHFEVKDNGIGIPADKHEEIFGIFRRLHGQDTRGTGIGLAVAKKAVERHGGRIWVESKPGSGSTFHFTLPRSLVGEGGKWTAAPAGRPKPGAGTA